MEYFIFELIFLLFLVCIHFVAKVKLFRSKTEMLLFWGSAFFIGILWDQLAIWRGHWRYADSKMLGINIGFMPLEDFIFIFVVDYAILLAYRISIMLAAKMKK
ncbi:MAG: lycopene cyclase domain-containing protein [Nanoarchaeota archaeon]